MLGGPSGVLMGWGKKGGVRTSYHHDSRPGRRGSSLSSAIHHHHLGVVRERPDREPSKPSLGGDAIAARANVVFLGKITPVIRGGRRRYWLSGCLAVGWALFSGCPFPRLRTRVRAGALLFPFVTPWAIGVPEISSRVREPGQAIQMSLHVPLPQVLLFRLILPAVPIAAGVR